MKEEQIIEVARELFHKFGFKKVSMDEIAKEAGVTKKTIYRYFNSKEALLEYFIQEEIQNMKTIIEEVESKNMDFFDTVNLYNFALISTLMLQIAFAFNSGYLLRRPNVSFYLATIVVLCFQRTKRVEGNI